MLSISLLRLAILGEGLLLLIALVWARWRETVFALGGATEGVLIGLIAAAGLGAANYYLLCGAPDLAGVRFDSSVVCRGSEADLREPFRVRDHHHQSGCWD